MPGLMGYLLAQDHAERASLADGWGLPESESTPAGLYRAMTDLWSFVSVTEGLDPNAKHVLATVVHARKHILSRQDLHVQLPLREKDLTAAVDRLLALGLIVRREGTGVALVAPDEIVACYSAISRLSRSADPSTAPLRTLLEELSVPELQRLAERWDISNPNTMLRTELLAQIELLLSNKDTARKAAAALEPNTRRTLTALVRAGGRLEVTRLKERLGVDESVIRQAASELGEVFLARQSFSGGVRALFVPVGVGTLEGVPEEQIELRPAPVLAPAPDTPRFAALWDLLTMLLLARPNKGRGGSLKLSEAQLRRLAPYFREQASQPELRADFLAALASGLGLVGDEGAEARRREWEALDFVAQGERAFRWWLQSERWREGLTQGERDIGGPVSLSSGRQRLLTALGECQPGRWYWLEPFLSRLRSREPLLFRDRRALLEAGGNAALERVSRYWDRWDGKVAWGAITLSLSWLEAVDTTVVNGDVAFTLTPFGAYLIGLPAAVAPERESGPSLQPEDDGTVVVVWPDAPTVAGLLRFARPLPGGQARYIVDRTSVLAAAGRGVTLSDIQYTLAGGGLAEGTSLPTRVREWMGFVARLSCGRVLILAAESDRDVDRLVSTSSYRSLRLTRLGPRHVLVGDEEEFARNLERLRSDGFVLTHGFPE